MGKGENAGNQHFLLFPHYFPPFPKRISITLILSSANASNLEQFKRLSSGKVLNAFHNYSYICSQWRSKSNCTKSLIYGLHCSFSWNTIKKKEIYTFLPYQWHNHHLSHIQFVICKYFQSVNFVQMIGWMVYTLLSTTLQLYLIDIFLHFLGFTIARIGLWNVLPKATSTKKKTQRIQRGSNLGPAGRKSYILPLSIWQRSK